jgi:glycosyltransferase involved in cell wall biosynthesis
MGALRLSTALRPDILYASDPLSSAPGVIAAHVSGAVLVYHEHDTPLLGALPRWLIRCRNASARRAQLFIVPNAERGRLVSQQTRQPSAKLRIVWNMPRKIEIPPPSTHESSRLTIYFHGSITPDRLPITVIDAMRRFDGRVRLLMAGYEAPGARGYLAQLLACGRGDGRSIIEYLGQIPYRDDLLRAASKADVGLAFMPNHSDDVNMRHMVGASNKPFDYMAAGLALLVSDLPDWVTTFCARGFGRCCDPSSSDSVAKALSWFLDHPSERRSMGEMGRQMIYDEWNYDTAFSCVLDELERL